MILPTNPGDKPSSNFSSGTFDGTTYSFSDGSRSSSNKFCSKTLYSSGRSSYEVGASRYCGPSGFRSEADISCSRIIFLTRYTLESATKTSFVPSSMARKTFCTVGPTFSLVAFWKSMPKRISSSLFSSSSSTAFLIAE